MRREAHVRGCILPQIITAVRVSCPRLYEHTPMAYARVTFSLSAIDLASIQAQQPERLLAVVTGDIRGASLWYQGVKDLMAFIIANL